jgi:hypothetical protein
MKKQIQNEDMDTQIGPNQKAKGKFKRKKKFDTRKFYPIASLTVVP